jgi:hypothetical protein
MVPIDRGSVQWNHEIVASPTPKSTVYTRTLTLAAESLGGAQPLAKHLKVEHATLERWIAGEEFPPHEVFLHALDVVAAGPRVDRDARPRTRRAQDHADRLQAAANRVRESARRLQTSAELAQAQAALLRANQARAEPAGSSSGQFRQVQPKDGAPASNKPEKPAGEEQKKAKG